MNAPLLRVEKFPKLLLNGHQLIWDSRQERSQGPELVVVPDNLAPAARQALLARPWASFVGSVGSGLDHEVEHPREFLAWAAAAACSHPSSELKVLTVTGTNGKSTSAALMRALIAERGHRVAELGTLGLSLWQGEQCFFQADTGFTTPEAPTLQHLFLQLQTLGISHVVMESSSHAISLDRVAAVDFDGVLFTNLSQDHLDFHGSMEAYEAAKAKLFTELLPAPGPSASDPLINRVPHWVKRKRAVINTADPAGARILRNLPLSVDARAYSLRQNVKLRKNSLEGLLIETSSGREFRSPLVGAYNAENIAGSQLLVDLCCGSSASDELALEKFPGAPGRLERVADPQKRRHVFVDYAHTPDALNKVLQTLRELKPETAKLSVVFGCGGDRDRSKRSLMGAVAVQFSDRVIVTADNPRSEDPSRIVEDILQGVSAEQKARVKVEVDRRDAIAHALRTLETGDICVVAGKGHEDYQIIGSERRHFSDRAVCAEMLAQSQATN